METEHSSCGPNARHPSDAVLSRHHAVVIPTYRRPDLLLRCLNAVLDQRLSPDSYEIIVVDDGQRRDTARGDGDRRDLGPLSSLRYRRPPTGRGPAVARNAGWRAARGELIAFTDDDTVPDPLWLSEGERALRAQPATWWPCAGASACRCPPRRPTTRA
jgi:glycosyltransferase involved in cell wall biosynthesis